MYTAMSLETGIISVDHPWIYFCQVAVGAAVYGICVAWVASTAAALEQVLGASPVDLPGWSLHHTHVCCRFRWGQ